MTEEERVQQIRETFGCICEGAEKYAELTQFCYSDCDCTRWDDIEHTEECRETMLRELQECYQ